MPEPRRPLHPDPTECVKFDTPVPTKIPEVKKKKANKKKSKTKKKQWEKDPLKVAAGKKAWAAKLAKPLKDAWFTDVRTGED